jgi:plasmid stability protein
VSDAPLKQLSVKVDRVTEERLKERAKGAGTNVSDCSRRILKEAVNGESELARLRLSVAGVQQDIDRLRRDLANAVEAILVMVATDEKVSPEQAKLWVDTKMRKPSD